MLSGDEREVRTIDWFESYLSVLEINDDDKHDLDKLQFQHLRKIPFQNIEGIKRGEQYIDFDCPESVLEPVLQQEGGICFQLNYSFHLLLKQLGYECYPIACRIHESDLDHMAIVVEQDKQYLVDVGFGEYFLTRPIPIVDGCIHRDRSGNYRITKDAEVYVLEKETRPNRWIRKFSFRLIPREFREFEPVFLRHHHYQSGFRENIIYSRWTDKGFVRVYNQRVTLYQNAKITKRIKLEGFEMENVLKWNWLNGILVMLGSSSDSDSDSKNEKKTWPCWCKSNPDLRYETKEGPFGRKISILRCRKCGWQDRQN
jgi:arylamine N-acetyltransferase